MQPDAPGRGNLPNVKTRRRPRLLLLATAFAATAVALLGLEVALRWLGIPDTNRLFLSAETLAKDMFVADPELFWKLSPTHAEGNAQGMRGPWWEGPKAANEVRIVGVGDSCTFGFGVAWHETWAVQLERIVQARQPDRVVRSALAALPGYSTFQDRRLLERVFDAAQPDVVAFYCGAWNDYVPAAGADDEQLARGLAASRVVWMLGSLFQPGLDHYRKAFANGEAPYGRRVPPDAFERNLGAMIARCRRGGATPLLIAPSHPASTTARFAGLAEYRDRVFALARRENVPCVDLADVCARLDPTGAPPIPGHTTACFLDWVHPAPNLHAALAQAVARELYPEAPAPTPPALLPQLAADGGALRVRACVRGAGPPHRVWLGAVPARATIDGADLCVALPGEVAPGEHALQVVDDLGARTLGRLEVPAPALRASRRTASELVFEGEAVPGRLVWLWATYDRPAAAVATPFGPFVLPLPAVREPIAGVARFDLAAEGRLQAMVGADGKWSIVLPISADPNAQPRTVFAQALVIDATTLRGALTTVASMPDRQ